MIVFDASAAIALLVDSSSQAAMEILARISAPGETLHAPHLLDLEVAQVLRRRVRLRTVAPERAQTALGRLPGLPVARYPHWPLLERIWQLRDNVTAYDAAYLALSEQLRAPLVTLDRRLATAPGHRAQVEVF